MCLMTSLYHFSASAVFFQSLLTLQSYAQQMKHVSQALLKHISSPIYGKESGRTPNRYVHRAFIVVIDSQ
jgi:hypothetical protein